MKIYTVVRCSFEDRHIDGVYLDEAQAKRHLKAIERLWNEDGEYEYSYVGEMEVKEKFDPQKFVRERRMDVEHALQLVKDL